MTGFITGRHVFLHAFTIVRLWGLSTYVRCLRASLSRRPTTFLAVVCACRALAVVGALGLAVTARADTKIADDSWNGSGRFTSLDYGVSERLERAWLMLHFTYDGPCRDMDGTCALDDPLRVRVPGLTYDPAARQVLYEEPGAAPLVCANVMHHRFLRSRETVDATGRCAPRLVKVRSFVDDGFGGKDEQREEIRFGARS
jgi:hypothetical protein